MCSQLYSLGSVGALSSSLFKQEPNDNPRITVDPNVNVRVEPRTDVTSEATITIAPHVFTMVNINVNYDSPGGRQ